MTSQSKSIEVKNNSAPLYVLQVCRGLACLMVALFHGTTLVEQWYGIKPLFGIYNFGFSGVHLFFVISGFIIYYVHYSDSERKNGMVHYLVKRVVRIYPLYWIVFFVWGGWRVFYGRYEVLDFISNLLFFWSDQKLVVPVAWTLAHEMVFYGLFAVFVYSRKWGYSLFCIWLLLVLNNYQYVWNNYIFLRLPNLLFILGLLASITFMFAKKHIAKIKLETMGVISMAIGVTVFILTTLYGRELASEVDIVDVWGNIRLTLGFGIGSAFILLSALSIRIENLLWKQNLMLLIGNASYSIYLVHFYIQRMAFNQTRAIDYIWAEKSQAMANVLLVIVMLASVGAGIIIHLKIEKPILAKLRGLLKTA